MAIETRGWQAWLDTMPPKPHTLHVSGDVVVANPGVQALLTMREPQGFNPAVLMLDLHLVQQPGGWIQVLAVAPARFERVMPPNSAPYRSVDILYENERIAFIDKISVVT